MSPTPKCVLDRSRPCTACIAPEPRSCPYPYLLAEQPTAAEPDQSAGPAAADSSAAAAARGADGPRR
jgi:hypothetical protein